LGAKKTLGVKKLALKPNVREKATPSQRQFRGRAVEMGGDGQKRRAFEAVLECGAILGYGGKEKK